ncbi:unnamed protein product [Rotaria magnacalcarata]|uniref:Uncharacterized protein n=2 Tax=Rotaria magnacalcarata TaxID=392030 RepID=A0A816QNJ5_9BILA|nr:unnamed protein product [Rotaria magnacalcarata]
MSRDQLENKTELSTISTKINSKEMPFAYSLNVETPSQLVDIMRDQGVYLPMNIGVKQMAEIRFVILARRLRQIPFDIIKIDDCWFIDKVFHRELDNYLKQGDRILIINKTMVSHQLQEIDIFKLILHSSIPFVLWVTWDIDTFLNYQKLFRQHENENAYIDAKAYLLQTNHYNDISLYDHLAYVITHAMQSPQDNMNDLLENLNETVQYQILESNLRPVKDNTKLTMLKIHAQLLEGKERDLIKSKDYIITVVPNLMEMAYFCSSAGYGIHMTEMILIGSAMKRLNNEINCIEMKFWGKIFGLHCDYYIIQVQHEKEMKFDEIDIINRSKHSNCRIEAKANQDQNIQFEVPSEPHGIGTNQYTYFVTNSPGLAWTKLPDVKPSMIDHARKIRCFFTGCLSAKVNSFPPYAGLERDYLRAQIARITATTHISPAGFYILTDNNDEEEAEEMTFNNDRKDPNIILNPEFSNDPTNPITVKQLAGKDLQEWVHSLPEILPQGRTRFWRPPSTLATNFSKEEEEEGNDDNEETLDRNSVEIPAPLLQPIGDDKNLHTNQNSWSIGLTMSIMHEYSLCYVRSNVWPGAFTLGHTVYGNFLNLYVGWGQKYEQFSPSQTSVPKVEFAKEFIEKNDPTVEVENAIERAQRETTSESMSDEYMSADDDGDEEIFTDEDD